MKPVALVAINAASPASVRKTASRQQTSIYIIGIRPAEGKKNDGMPSNPEVRIIIRTLLMLFAGILPAFVLWDVMYSLQDYIVTNGGPLPNTNAIALFFTFQFCLAWAWMVAASFEEAMNKIEIAKDTQK